MELDQSDSGSKEEQNELEESFRNKKLSVVPIQLISPTEISTSTLEILKLDGNEFKELPESMFNHLKCLKKLVLDRNGLTSLPSSLISLPNLQVLCCSHNLIAHFPLEILHSKTLRKLDLSSNLISNISEEIFDSKFAFKSRKVLLYRNPLPSGLALVIATFFAKEMTIELSESDLISEVKNKNSGRSRASSSPITMQTENLTLTKRKLPESLEKLDFLHCFSAKRCQLSALDDNIYGLKELELLDLSENNFEEIPSGILNHFLHLKELCFSRNQLTRIPEEIMMLKHLKILLLEENSLFEFPESFFTLERLKILRISKNKFKVLPTLFLHLKNLEAIYAEENQLEEVPHFMYNLPKLKTFTLEGNPLPDSFFLSNYSPNVKSKVSHRSEDPNVRIPFLFSASDEEEEEKSLIESQKGSKNSSSSSIRSREDSFTSVNTASSTPSNSPNLMPSPQKKIGTSSSQKENQMNHLREKMVKKMLSSSGFLTRPNGPSDPISIPGNNNRNPMRASSSELVQNRPAPLSRAGTSSSLILGDESPFEMLLTPSSSLGRDVPKIIERNKDIWNLKAIDHVRKRMSQTIQKEERFLDIPLDQLRKELNEKFSQDAPQTNLNQNSVNLMTSLPTSAFKSTPRVSGTKVPPELQIRKTESENLSEMPSVIAYHSSQDIDSSSHSKRKTFKSKFQSLFNIKGKKPLNHTRNSLDQGSVKTENKVKTMKTSPSLSSSISSSSNKNNSFSLFTSPTKEDRLIRKTVSISEETLSPESNSGEDTPRSRFGRLRGATLSKKKGTLAHDNIIVENTLFPALPKRTESKEKVETMPKMNIEPTGDLLCDKDEQGSHVYAASLDAIVKLTLREDYGQYFQKALVYTYHCYSNTLELTKTIYNYLNEGNSNRALELLLHVKSVHPQDFNEEKTELHNFMQSKPEIYEKFSAHVPEQEPQIKKEPALVAPASNKKSVLAFHPEELARQMTIVESELFRKIEPTEYLSNTWKKGSPQGNMGAIINHFNETSRWVSTEIVMTNSIEDRIDIICHFLMVAVRCIRMNNFNGAMEIFSGLEALSVSRLKQTWQRIPKESQKVMEELREFLSVVGNWKVLRKQVSICSPPAVPYIGIAMSDLVFIDEYPSKIEGVDGGDLINWRKYEMIAQVVQKMHRLKHKEYNYEVAPAIREYLKNVLVLGDQVLYQCSLEKEGKDENAAFMIQQGQKEEKKKKDRSRKMTIS